MHPLCLVSCPNNLSDDFLPCELRLECARKILFFKENNVCFFSGATDTPVLDF